MNNNFPHCKTLAGCKNFFMSGVLVALLVGALPLAAFPVIPPVSDEPAQREIEGETPKHGDPQGRPKSEEAARVDEPEEKPADEKKKKLSYFTRLWELDEEDRYGKSAIRAHRSNYALAFSYNGSPNLDAVREADPDKTLTKPEVTFQLSFKTKLWEDVLGQKMDLWFGYTQRSFWQLYNFDDSSPFRETNYEPEFLLNFRTHFNVLGLKARFITIGLNHQSNGQSEPLSRSWNRIVANMGFEKGDFSLLLKGWWRIPESDEEDDNPGIENYLGHGEIWAYYFLKKSRFGIMLRNNLDFGTNRGAVQIEWSFALFAQVSGYVQYYLGYGENLLDYNHRVNRIGVGFILSDWY